MSGDARAKLDAGTSRHVARTAGSAATPIPDGMLLLTATLTVLVIYWTLSTPGRAPEAVSLAVLVLVAALAVHAARFFSDALNPLTVLLVLVLVRLGLPSLLLLDPHMLPPAGTPLNDFSVTRDELIEAQELALLGVLAVIAGWYACPRRAIAGAESVFHLMGRVPTGDPRMIPSALAAFAGGVIAAIVYLALNFGDPVGAAAAGVAREGALAGTSRYGFAAVALLTTSSTVLVLYAAQRRPPLPWAATLSPALVATAILTVFGGRVVALTPLGLGLVGARYLRHEDPSQMTHRRRTLGKPLAAVLLVTALVAYAAFVPQYRGGGGASALADVLNPSALGEYVEFSIWTELGTLHPYALAHRVGAGSLDGATYPALLGLFGSLLGLEGDRPGSVLVERLGLGASDADWGFHTGIVVDVFLNSGMGPAVLAAGLFGALLRAEYEAFSRFPAALGPTFLHCVVLWTLVWIYFESIVVLPSQVELVLPVFAFIVLLSRLAPTRQRA
jgi:hypothetical protein